MIGGKFYGWTPPKKTTTTSSPTFGSIVANYVKNYKPPKKETKHPLTGASGTSKPKTPVYGVDERRAQNNQGSSNTQSFWAQLTNLPKETQNAAAQASKPDYSDPYGRPTMGYGFGRGDEPSPIVDVDVRRAQLGADTSGDGDGGGGGNSGGSTPGNDIPGGGDGGEEVFKGPTEAELALERAKRLWSSRLKTAAAAAESARKRLLLESDAANEANLRDTYGKFRDHRRSLSGSGTGFSPRFTLAVKDALDQQSRARAAEIRSSHIGQMRDIINNLRDVRDDASENLSDEELNRLLTASGDNLANISDSDMSKMFGTRAARTP